MKFSSGSWVARILSLFFVTYVAPESKRLRKAADFVDIHAIKQFAWVISIFPPLTERAIQITYPIFLEQNQQLKNLKTKVVISKINLPINIRNKLGNKFLKKVDSVHLKNKFGGICDDGFVQSIENFGENKKVNKTIQKPITLYQSRYLKKK